MNTSLSKLRETGGWGSLVSCSPASQRVGQDVVTEEPPPTFKKVCKPFGRFSNPLRRGLKACHPQEPIIKVLPSPQANPSPMAFSSPNMVSIKFESPEGIRDARGGAEGVAQCTHPANQKAVSTPHTREPNKVSLEKTRLSTHMSAAPALAGRWAHKLGTPSVITLGKIKRLTRGKGFPDLPGWWAFCFFRLRLRFVVWACKVNNDNDSSNKTDKEQFTCFV